MIMLIIGMVIGGLVGMLLMGLLARGKMEDYEERLGWSETQRLRLQSRIDHEEDIHTDWKASWENYLKRLAYSDDMKEKT